MLQNNAMSKITPKIDIDAESVDGIDNSAPSQARVRTAPQSSHCQGEDSEAGQTQGTLG